MTTLKYLRRGSVSAVLGAGLILIGTGSAAAHVTVSAPEAEPGHTTVATFRVPTESDTAVTTAVRVTVPELDTASVEPVPGWTAKVERNALDKVTAVVWTAIPGTPGIRAGEFQRFAVSFGPLPDADTVSFPAEQTYSDGKVVAWNETGDHDSAQHPAPVLTLAGHDHHGEQTTTAAEAGGTDATARWLGGLGLALGLVGLGAGVGAVLRGRR